jgi:hypothetical protein
VTWQPSFRGNGETPELIVQSKGQVALPQLLADGKSVMFTDATSQPYKVIIMQSQIRAGGMRIEVEMTKNPEVHVDFDI